MNHQTRTNELFVNHIGSRDILESTTSEDCIYGFAVHHDETGQLTGKVLFLGASSSGTYVLTFETHTLVVLPGEPDSVEIGQKLLRGRKHLLDHVTVTNVDTQSIKYTERLADAGWFPYETPLSKNPISSAFTYETRVYIKHSCPTRMIICQFVKTTGTYVVFEDEQKNIHKVKSTMLDDIIPNMIEGKVSVLANYTIGFASCAITPEWIPGWKIFQSPILSDFTAQIDSDSDSDSDSDASYGGATP